MNQTINIPQVLEIKYKYKIPHEATRDEKKSFVSLLRLKALFHRSSNHDSQNGSPPTWDSFIKR